MYVNMLGATAFRFISSNSWNAVSQLPLMRQKPSSRLYVSKSASTFNCFIISYTCSRPTPKRRSDPPYVSPSARTSLTAPVRATAERGADTEMDSAWDEEQQPRQPCVLGGCRETRHGARAWKAVFSSWQQRSHKLMSALNTAGEVASGHSWSSIHCSATMPSGGPPMGPN